jgi:hypothetical protein
VAVSVREFSETSNCTPVITGVTSSFEAARETCATASAKASAGTSPETVSTRGTCGYSSTGIAGRLNEAELHFNCTRESARETSTSESGRR